MSLLADPVICSEMPLPFPEAHAIDLGADPRSLPIRSRHHCNSDEVLRRLLRLQECHEALAGHPSKSGHRRTAALPLILAAAITTISISRTDRR